MLKNKFNMHYYVSIIKHKHNNYFKLLNMCYLGQEQWVICSSLFLPHFLFLPKKMSDGKIYKS